MAFRTENEWKIFHLSIYYTFEPIIESKILQPNQTNILAHRGKFKCIQIIQQITKNQKINLYSWKISTRVYSWAHRFSACKKLKLIPMRWKTWEHFDWNILSRSKFISRDMCFFLFRCEQGHCYIFSIWLNPVSAMQTSTFQPELSRVLCPELLFFSFEFEKKAKNIDYSRSFHVCLCFVFGDLRFILFSVESNEAYF